VANCITLTGGLGCLTATTPKQSAIDIGMPQHCKLPIFGNLSSKETDKKTDKNLVRKLVKNNDTTL
jgi:hypothetical protein